MQPAPYPSNSLPMESIFLQVKEKGVVGDHAKD